MAETQAVTPGPERDTLFGSPVEPTLAEKSWKSMIEWVGIIVVALLAAVLLKTFLVQAFFIPSESMEPTLHIGDRVLVNKLSYRLHEVHRTDVVVFERPPGQTGDPTIKDLIKRVIGLPGDRIESRDGAMWINGKRLPEPYLPAGTVTSGVEPQVVPAGHYFVMGDNRSNSRDSRYFCDSTCKAAGGSGAIPESLIVGRAFVRVWPLGSFKRM